mmetsp:Transcript_13133/g.33760  ORF Transcript_13133/g.33760 Transcript_13133/m.33760 type:complete len:244 (-) Transcript_13133:6-737(-)
MPGTALTSTFPEPTALSKPTMRRTWWYRKERARAVTIICSCGARLLSEEAAPGTHCAPPSVTRTDNSSNVRSGEAATHPAARKELKSCSPSSTAAARDMDITSRGSRTCHTVPCSKTEGGSPPLNIRYWYVLPVARCRAWNSRGTARAIRTRRSPPILDRKWFTPRATTSGLCGTASLPGFETRVRSTWQEFSAACTPASVLEDPVTVTSPPAMNFEMAASLYLTGRPRGAVGLQCRHLAKHV